MLNRNRVTRAGFVIFLLLVLGLNFYMVAPYLLALLMGGILAIVTRPLYEKLRNKKVGPKTASAIVVLLTAIVVIAPLSGMIIMAVNQALEVGKHLVATKALSVSDWVEQISHWPVVRTFLSNPQEVNEKLNEMVQKAASGGSALLLGFLGSLPEYGLQVALAILTMFFFLVDGRRFMEWLRSDIPLDPEVRGLLFGAIRYTAVSTIWATLAAAGAQAGLIFFGFLALGVGQAFLAAGCTFLFAWIPILGSGPVWIVATIYLWSSGQVWKAVVMVALGIVVGVVDNFVRALVIKGKGDMHPLVSLVSIFGGIHLFGIWGVFLGPIFTSVLLALLQVWPKVARGMGLTNNGMADALSLDRRAIERS